METKNRVTVVTLVRQDDLPKDTTKPKDDAKSYVRRYAKRIRRNVDSDPKCSFRDFYFVLGRASAALILECERLSEVPELVQLVTKTHRHLRKFEKDHGKDIGAFGAYCFPMIEVKIPPSEATRNVVPALIFVRTPQKLENCVSGILAQDSVVEHIETVYLGLGLYDLIIQAGFPTIHRLRDVYCTLRKHLSPFWETATVIGVPRHGTRTIEKTQARSLGRVPFSTSVKCMSGLDVEVKMKIDELFTKTSFRRLVPKRKRYCVSQNTNLRQGYMDLETHYQSRTVSDAFRVTCAIRKINGVVDTCTVAQLPLKENGISGR